MTDYESFFSTVEDANEFTKRNVLTTFTQECPHENYIEDSRKIRTCTDCCMEIEMLHFESEWRNYGGCADSSRCLMNNNTSSSLEKILQDCEVQILQIRVIEASQKFDYVIEKLYKDKTIRGSHRKGIGGACIMYTMRKYGAAVTTTDICNMLKIDATTLSKGQTSFLEVFPEFKTEYITPKQLINKTLEKIGFENEKINNISPKILKLNDYIDKKSQLIVRSSPDSVAAAVVFVCLSNLCEEEMKTMGITKKVFAEKVEISEMTIKRLAEDIKKIMKGG